MSGKGADDPSAAQVADGSEGVGLASSVGLKQLVVTAFGPFHGVPVNPTMQLLHGLADVAKAQGCEGLGCEGGEAHEVLLHLPPTEACGVQLVVLETSGEGSRAALTQLQTQHTQHNTGGVLWLHLGVDSSAQAFKLEGRAVNEADFRCADMRGWTPQKQPIMTHAQPCLYTPIDTHKLVCELSQEGWPVTTSDDAGRYVCNWVYFHSLQHCQTQSDTNTWSLFLHVPPSSVVSLDRQRLFLLSLLTKLLQHLCPDPLCPPPLPAFLSLPLPPSYAMPAPSPVSAPVAVAESGLVTALLELGFDRGVCEGAAAHFQHDATRLEAAAMWILEQGERDDTQPPNNSGGSVSLQSYAHDALTSARPCKMVLCVRGDLNMGVGKIAAQCCHAALGAYESCKEGVYASVGGAALVATWQAQGEPTIALRATDLQAIEGLEQQARSLGLPTHTVRDAGRTQVAAGSVTVLAIGPAPSDVINAVTGHLKLL